jgi:hypothetical protein
MNDELKLIAVRTVYVVCIFTAAMIGLVLILDVVVMPILREVLRGSTRNYWCGVFARCASGTQFPFFAYIWSGAPWKHLNIITVQDRAERAAILGVLIGVAFMCYSFFAYRR